MIIHLDLDCYFVSAERTRSACLKNRPVVVVKSGDREIFSQHDKKRVMTQRVGAFNGLTQHEKSWERFDPEGWKKEFIDEQGRVHGIVLARSYECKPYGIKTGTLLRDALKLCPNLMVVSGDHLFYQRLSGKLRSFLETKIPVLEQYSIDEFWGDLQGWVKPEDTESFVRELQHDILETFDLPLSIGVSSSKWIAKLATDFHKPFGITIVPQNEIVSFVSPLSIHTFPGIGKALSQKLLSYRIKTLGDLLASKTLLYGWGRVGRELYAKVSGEDGERVHQRDDRHSLGLSRNFPLTQDREEIKRKTVILARHLAHTVMKLDVLPTTYTFKLKYDGGGKSSVCVTVDRPFSETLFRELCVTTIEQIDTLRHYAICHISLSCSNFVTPFKTKTFSLLHHETDTKNQKLSFHVTQLRDKYGVDIVRCGIEKGGNPS